MSYTIIAVDVYCEEKTETHPTYRVFLDDQLAVERPFWPNNEEYFIQEQLTMENDGKEHSISVVNIFEEYGTLNMKKVRFLNGEDKEVLKINSAYNGDSSIKFTLPKR